jgi:pyruvate/2-oxoglutarate dehydrogenase complex dihydrolipoamide acyltransferase (E2) component
MLAEIIMPKMGDASADCWVEEWKKSIGETVGMGEVICVISIDKAAFDFESPYDGTLAEILVQPDVTVSSGTPIGRIEVSEDVVV